MTHYLALDKAIVNVYDWVASPHLGERGFLSRQVALIGTSSLEALSDEKGRVRDLFFRELPPCDYDRSQILVRSPLESILDPEIYSAHDAPDRIDPVSGRRIHETIAETHFALRTGVVPEKAPSEYHEVFYLLSRSQERLGVFKPHMDKLPLEDHYGASEDRDAVLAEVANSQLDDLLGTRVVPHTELLRCDFPRLKATGSYQFYVADTPFLEERLQGDNFFDPDHAALRQRLDKAANRALHLPNFEEFAFFDLLTANNDRHFRNTLLKATGDLVAIDNGNSFPWCHDRELPSYKMRPLHWFKWSVLPHAAAPFSQRMVDKIHHLDFEAVQALLRKALMSEEVPSSIERIEGKLRTLQDRFRTIQQLAHKSASMAQIAEKILQLA